MSSSTSHAQRRLQRAILCQPLLTHPKISSLKLIQRSNSNNSVKTALQFMDWFSPQFRLAHPGILIDTDDSAVKTEESDSNSTKANGLNPNDLSNLTSEAESILSETQEAAFASGQVLAQAAANSAEAQEASKNLSKEAKALLDRIQSENNFTDEDMEKLGASTLKMLEENVRGSLEMRGRGVLDETGSATESDNDSKADGNLTGTSSNSTGGNSAESGGDGSADSTQDSEFVIRLATDEEVVLPIGEKDTPHQLLLRISRLGQDMEE